MSATSLTGTLICLGLVAALAAAAAGSPTDFLQFSPSGTVLGVGTGTSLRFLDTASGRPLWSIQDAVAAAFLPGDRIALQTKTLPLQVRDAVTGKPLQTLSGAAGIVGPFAVRSDGKAVAAGAKGALVHVWDSSTGSFVRTLRTRGREIWAIEMAADGQSLAAGIMVKRGQNDVHLVQLWDLARGVVRRVERGTGFRFSTDGGALYTWGGGQAYEGVIREWSTRSGRLRRPLKMEQGCEVNGLAFWGRGEVLAIEFGGCSEHFVHGVSWWDARTLKDLGRLSEFQRDAAVSLTSTPWVLLIQPREAETVRVTDVRSNRERTFTDPDAGFDAVLSPDGRLIAIPSRGQLHVSDVASGKLLFSVPR